MSEAKELISINHLDGLLRKQERMTEHTIEMKKVVAKQYMNMDEDGKTVFIASHDGFDIRHQASGTIIVINDWPERPFGVTLKQFREMERFAFEGRKQRIESEMTDSLHPWQIDIKAQAGKFMPEPGLGKVIFVEAEKFGGTPEQYGKMRQNLQSPHWVQCAGDVNFVPKFSESRVHRQHREHSPSTIEDWMMFGPDGEVKCRGFDFLWMVRDVINNKPVIRIVRADPLDNEAMDLLMDHLHGRNVVFDRSQFSAEWFEKNGFIPQIGRGGNWGRWVK